MLVQFTLENWKSFRDEITFSMVATREKQHGDRIYKSDKLKNKILPAAAIFGGNASGKTNFIKALEFAQQFIVGGTKPSQSISVDPFILNPLTKSQPTRMSFTFLIDEMCYEFSFAVTEYEVTKETLRTISPYTEKTIYQRTGNEIVYKQKEMAKDKFYEFVAQSTRSNQLLLTTMINLNADRFRPVYDWFAQHLHIIGPRYRFTNFELFLDRNYPLKDWVNSRIKLFDSGITQLEGVDISLDQVPLSETEINDLSEQLGECKSARLSVNPRGDRHVISKMNNQLSAVKLISYHKSSDGCNVEFEVARESSGTQRLIDLLPAFQVLSSSDAQNLFVIDEIDRSLHSDLITQLVEEYLSNCSNSSKSQLILTTHNLMLMDQQIFRRDELWVTERDNTENTDLISLCAYKNIRFDKDIRKSYLEGRLGGIPHLAIRGTFNSRIQSYNEHSGETD